MPMRFNDPKTTSTGFRSTSGLRLPRKDLVASYRDIKDGKLIDMMGQRDGEIFEGLALKGDGTAYIEIYKQDGTPLTDADLPDNFTIEMEVVIKETSDNSGYFGCKRSGDDRFYLNNESNKFKVGLWDWNPLTNYDLTLNESVNVKISYNNGDGEIKINDSVDTSTNGVTRTDSNQVLQLLTMGDGWYKSHHQLYSFKIINNDTNQPIIDYKIDSTTGTNSNFPYLIDSVGNTHGLIKNAVLSTVYGVNNDTKSYANEEGYTLSDGTTYCLDSLATILIPQGVRIPSYDLDKSKCCAFYVDGTRVDLQHRGRIKYNCRVIRGCVDNGVDYGNWDDGIRTSDGITFENKTYFEVDTKAPNMKSATEYLFDYTISNSNFSTGQFLFQLVGIFDTQLILNTSNGNYRALTTTRDTIVDDTLRVLVANANGLETITIKINGIYEASLFANPLTDPLPTTEKLQQGISIIPPKCPALIQSDLSHQFFNNGEPNIIPCEHIKDRFYLENLLCRDGNFELDSGSGIGDGWSSAFGTSLENIINNVQKFTPTAQYGQVRATISESINDLQYACAFVKSSSTNTNFDIQRSGGSSSDDTSAVHTGSGNYEFMSSTIRVLSPTSSLIVRCRNDSISDWTEIEIKQVHLLNLTQLYGKGNEPTKEEMDIIVQNIIDKYGYFDTYYLDNMFAKKEDNQIKQMVMYAKKQVYPALRKILKYMKIK